MHIAAITSCRQTCIYDCMRVASGGCTCASEVRMLLALQHEHSALPNTAMVGEEETTRHTSSPNPTAYSSKGLPRQQPQRPLCSVSALTAPAPQRRPWKQATDGKRRCWTSAASSRSAHGATLVVARGNSAGGRFRWDDASPPVVCHHDQCRRWPDSMAPILP
jgi:hypothetical protein